MVHSQLDLPTGEKCFQASAPFTFSKALAKQHDCDLAIPNGLGTGIGNVLMFTPLVEAVALRLGRRLRILSAPLNPRIGVVAREEPYPVWLQNPFVQAIEEISPGHADWIAAINAEQDSCCQFNHVIENICFHYGVRHRALRPQLFLSQEECAWALDQLRGLPRPVIALHPAGTTASTNRDAWGECRWLDIIEHSEAVSFVQIGKPDADEPCLGIHKPTTTLRQAFALIWASDAFIGFDSSPMHVATAFQKPVLALWDAHKKLQSEESWQTAFSPAVMLRWGYPQNRNVMILGERDRELVDVVLTWLHDVVRTLSAPYFTVNTAVPDSRSAV